MYIIVYIYMFIDICTYLQVLDNYKSWAGPAAVDMDLVKRRLGSRQSIMKGP